MLSGEDGPNVLVVAGTAAGKLVTELERNGGVFTPAVAGASGPTWHIWTKYYSADVELHVPALDAVLSPSTGAELLPAGCALVLAFDLSASSADSGGPSAQSRAEWQAVLDKLDEHGACVETRVCVGFEPKPQAEERADTLTGDADARRKTAADVQAEAARLAEWSLAISAEFVHVVEGEEAQPSARERVGVSRVCEIVECHSWAHMHTPPLPPRGSQGQSAPPLAMAAPEMSDHLSHAHGALGTLECAAAAEHGTGSSGSAAEARAVDTPSIDDAAASELAALRAQATRPRVRAALDALHATFAQSSALAANGALPAPAAAASAPAATTEQPAAAAATAAADAAELRRLNSSARRPRTHAALRALLVEAEAEAAQLTRAAGGAVAEPAGPRGSAAPASRAPPLPRCAAAAGDDDDEREAAARVQQLMASAGLDGPHAALDGGEEADGDGSSAGLEKLMAQMAHIRDHGHGMDDADRRKRAAELAMEAARLCGFADDENGSSSEGEDA